MSLFKNIQTKLSNISLRKKAPKREVKAINLKQAKTIGLVYFAGDEEASSLVKRYVKYLRDYGVKVKSIGYFDEKDLPYDVNPKLEFDFLCKKDLNLRLQPDCVVANNFVDEEFDILIDCNVTEVTPLKYLSVISRAKFKVGANCLDYSDSFDFSINLKNGEGVRALMKNIDHYLLLINK